MKLADSAYLLVRVAGRRVGLALSSVVEVLEPGPVYPVPCAEAAVRGVTASAGPSYRWWTSVRCSPAPPAA